VPVGVTKIILLGMVSIDGRERGQLEAPETNNLRDNEVHKRNGVRQFLMEGEVNKLEPLTLYLFMA
jgi:hypothetical protein